MNKLYTILIISLLFLLIGCSTDLDTLEDRVGVYYKINSEEQFSGTIIKKYESGQEQTKGYLKNGRKDGLWTRWYKNGQKWMEGTFKDGEEDGLYTEWYKNGQKKEESILKDGKMDGLHTEWYEYDGQKKEEGNYKDGELISSKCWDEDGNEKECD